MYLSRVTLKPNIGQHSQLGKLLQNSTYGTHQLLWDLFDQEKRDFLYREEIAKQQIPNQTGPKGEPIYYLLSSSMPKTDTPLFHTETKEFKPQITNGQRLAFRLRANPIITKDKKRHDLVMDEQLQLFRKICSETGLPSHGKKSTLKVRINDKDNQSLATDWLCSYLSQTRYFSNANQHHSIPKLLDLAIQEAVSQRLIKWLTDSPSRSGIFSICDQYVDDEFLDQSVTVPMFQWHGYQAHPLHEKHHKKADKPTGRNSVPRFLSVEMSGEITVQDPARFLDMIEKGIGPAKAFGCGLMLVRRI